MDYNEYITFSIHIILQLFDYVDLISFYKKNIGTSTNFILKISKEQHVSLYWKINLMKLFEIKIQFQVVLNISNKLRIKDICLR